MNYNVLIDETPYMRLVVIKLSHGCHKIVIFLLYY
jgi:hypothetical protein